MPGYDTVFLNGVDNQYVCGKCHLVLREPFQTECGHRFCQSCIEVVITSGSKRCPVDHALVSRNVIFKDEFCNEKILELQCFCSSKYRGCNWTGALKELEEHHKECPRFLLECPEGCQKIMPRSEMNVHWKQGCSFLNNNCAMTGQCEWQGSTEEVREHLADKNVHQQQHILGASLDNDREELGILRDDLASRRPVDDFHKKRIAKTEGTQPWSARETTPGRRSGASKLEDIKPRSAKLDNRMKEIEVLRNLRQESTTQNSAANLDCGNEAGVDLGRTLATMEQENTSRSVQTEHRGVKISIPETTTCNGDFVWKISNVGQHLQDAVAGIRRSIYSPVFYVGCHGYKVCARACLNGDGTGKDTHLSLFFVVMGGAHDANLSWPFNKNVIIKLIDQSNDNHIIREFRPCLERPTDYPTENAGFPQFLLKSELTNGDYIKQGTMLVKITVEPTSILGL